MSSVKTSRERLIKEYFHWLCDIINVNQENKSYYFLANDLFRKEYTWFIPNDDNRANDGKLLRIAFIDENGYDFDSRFIKQALFLEAPCSMLEMLVAVAKRMNDTMDELDNCDKTPKWFMVLIKNLGLDPFTDEDYYDFGGWNTIESILDNFLKRTYRRNGKGGLFPLKNTKKDQRKVEIWYQMNEYLLENYY